MLSPDEHGASTSKTRRQPLSAHARDYERVCVPLLQTTGTILTALAIGGVVWNSYELHYSVHAAIVPRNASSHNLTTTLAAPSLPAWLMSASPPATPPLFRVPLPSFGKLPIDAEGVQPFASSTFWYALRLVWQAKCHVAAFIYVFAGAGRAGLQARRCAPFLLLMRPIRRAGDIGGADTHQRTPWLAPRHALLQPPASPPVRLTAGSRRKKCVCNKCDLRASAAAQAMLLPLVWSYPLRDDPLGRLLQNTEASRSSGGLRTILMPGPTLGWAGDEP
jgi:hypothetical protein